MEIKRGYFGNVQLDTVYCAECEDTTFVVDNHKVCCNRVVVGVISVTKRMSSGKPVRGHIKKDFKKLMLKAFKNCCAYCGDSFEAPGVKLNWDHAIPFNYSSNDFEYNIVPVCRDCNIIKGNQIFDNWEEMVTYVQKEKRQRRIRKSSL